MPDDARKILVLSQGVVGQRMSSLGIRSYHIARVLAARLPQATVTLAVPTETELRSQELLFRVVRYTPSSLKPLAREHDIMISYTLPVGLLPHTRDTRVVLDLYGVYLPEWLEIANAELQPSQRRAWVDTQRRKLNLLLTWADFVLYANERQRHLYLGMLSAIGRVTPDAYAQDRRLNQLLGLAPLGVRPGEPVATARVLKGVHPGIRESDKVLIWNGAVTEWFDLETLLRAVHQLSQERDDIKLFFMGTELPSNPQPARLKGVGAVAVKEALRLCKELDLLDRSVFFNIDWVGYDDTANYLLEADIGVCTYFPSLETDYSFRTRFLDLFWAERPIVCTEGDVLAEEVERRRLGLTVPPRDVQALATAIRRLADDEALVQACKVNLRQAREDYRWEKVLEPLIEFCTTPAPKPSGRRERRWALAYRLACYRAGRLWQLATTRSSGPAYL